MQLTTPMTEESKWTSQRRRSSAALRMRSLESEKPSFFAISEISIICLFLEVNMAMRFLVFFFFFFEEWGLRCGFWRDEKWRCLVLFSIWVFEYSRAHCLPGNVFIWRSSFGENWFCWFVSLMIDICII